MEEFRKYFFQTNFHYNFQARNGKISSIFHFDLGYNGWVCHILCGKYIMTLAYYLNDLIYVIKKFQICKDGSCVSSICGKFNQVECTLKDASPCQIHCQVPKRHNIYIRTVSSQHLLHCRRNGSNLFQITADAHPGVSKDQKFCEEFKNIHCQVDHPAKIE